MSTIHKLDKDQYSVKEIGGLGIGVDARDLSTSQAFDAYTPPTAKSDIEFRIVRDTDGSHGGIRLYIWDGTSWLHATLTAVS